MREIQYNCSLFTPIFLHYWNQNTTLQVFRIVTSKDRKVHHQWTVNIWYILCVGSNPFICRQWRGQAGILLSPKTTLHSYSNFPCILMLLMTTVVFVFVDSRSFHDCDSDCHLLCPDNVARYNWGEIVWT
jgi:hypothetical protein